MIMYNSIATTTFSKYCHNPYHLLFTFQLFPVQSLLYSFLNCYQQFSEISFLTFKMYVFYFLGILEGRVLEERIQQIMATHAELLTRTRTEASRR